MAKDPFVINLKKPEDSPEQIANKLNMLHSAVDISVIKGALPREEFESYKKNNDKVVAGYEDRVNYNISQGTKKLTDMRYHGAGSGLSVVSHDATLSGLGTSGSPLSVVGGGGTVTSVSVANANGFSGTVASASSTPAITIIAGNITPTSVSASGTIGGSNFSGTSSGTNTGDQTNISGNAATVTTNANLTGAVTSSGNTTSLGSFSSANLASALTDETGTGANVFANKPTFVGTIQTVTAMGAQALDGSTANVFTRTLAASETFTQSNFSTGQCFMVEVKQGSGTSYTVTWFSGISWITSGSTAPVQTTTTNGITTYGFRCTGSNTFLGYLIGTQ